MSKTVSHDDLIDILSEVIGKERKLTTQQIGNLDGSQIIKGAIGSLLSANVAALDQYLTSIEVRKSEVLADASKLPSVVAQVVK